MLNIQKNVKLSEYSTFKIGGEAKEFVEVKNEKEFLEVINYVKENNLKFFILGGGSNVLFDDRGFEGIIIKISAPSPRRAQQGGPALGWQDTSLEFWAGYSLSSLVNFARDNNLTGLEWAVGIPGTIGGAVRGNAGAFGGAMADVIAEVKAYDTSELKVVNYELKNCDFGYRDSIFKKNPELVIVSAKIKLEKGDKEKIKEKMKEILKKRSIKQPKDWIGSAGSFFKNPIVEDEKLRKKFSAQGGPASGWEKKMKSRISDKRISAGWLIEEAGLKGEKFGNISVSDTNANFLINSGSGTMEEVLMAASIIKQKIRDKFGIEIQEEAKIVYY